MLAAGLAACLLGAVAAWALAAGPVSGVTASATTTQPTAGSAPPDGTSTGPPSTGTPPPARLRRPAPPAYPSRAAIAAAVSYLNARAGRTSLAVVDSQGRLSGVRLRSRFESASVVKVMFLTAFLQRLNADRRGVSALDRSLLYPMIHESNNEAASAVLDRVGGAAVARVAREAGMHDYAPGVGWWAFTQTSAADQARFFFRLDRLIPPRLYAYARQLLSSIEPSQSWGIPPVARPRFEVFFKTGQLPSEGLYNEAARLERPGETFAIAVLTTTEPSMSYGRQTVEGVARALLGG